MNHYTYILKDPNSDMKYIGVRSCACPIAKDPYKGSSCIMTTEEKRTCIKSVLGVFKTRSEAMAHEIELHATFNVSENTDYWNMAKATVSGFIRTGPHSQETKDAISAKMKGKLLSADHKEALCKAQKRRWDEGRGSKLVHFPKGEAHPARTYTGVYEWKNRDGRVFIGTNLEFLQLVKLKNIQNITKIVKGEVIQYRGWYIVKNTTTNCSTSDNSVVEVYEWVNGDQFFTGTGFQLSIHAKFSSLSGVNKVARGDRVSTQGWSIKK